VKKLPTALERNAEDAKLLVQVIEFYHQTLLQSPEALDYLAKRGLPSTEAIGHFKLGFANRTLGYRLPEKNRVDGAALAIVEVARERDPPMERVVDGLRGGRAVGHLLPLRQ
jgi:DNA primase